MVSEAQLGTGGLPRFCSAEPHLAHCSAGILGLCLSGSRLPGMLSKLHEGKVIV